MYLSYLRAVGLVCSPHLTYVTYRIYPFDYELRGLYTENIASQLPSQAYATRRSVLKGALVAR